MKDKGERDRREMRRAAAFEISLLPVKERGKEGGFGRKSQTAVQF